MSGNKFLFIRILDEELVALFKGLKLVFNGRESTSPVHITVKGPQKSKFKNTLRDRFSEINVPLTISQSDYFTYSGKYFVHFKVQIPKMEKYQLWYKPTFGNEKNPHITICETSNENLSKDIVEFLNKEVGVLTCRDYKFIQHTLSPFSQHILSPFSQHTLSQSDIVSQVSLEKTRNIDDTSIPNLINTEKVRKGLFTRARKIRVNHTNPPNREMQAILHAN